MTLIVTLPSGRPIPLRMYTRAWKSLKGLPFDALISDWDLFPTKAFDILRELRGGMHDRINRHIPGYGLGRKWSDVWQTEALRTARDVNTPRLIVRWIPRDLRPRLAHRLFQEA